MDAAHPPPAVEPGMDAGLLRERPARRPPRETRFQRWVIGRRTEPPAALMGLYEEVGPEDIGVSCSGGGIRSAAFNLGALQALQQPGEGREGVLQKAKYVAAVSGGSYIAAAFCMVAKTWSTETYPKPGQGPPAADNDDSDPRLVNDAAPPFYRGSPEEQYLRTHLGYLAPDGMARVYLALRMLAGLLVNVLLVGLPVFIAGLVAGWYVQHHYGGMTRGITCRRGGSCDFASHPPQALGIAVAATAGLALVVALLSVLWRPRNDAVRQALETWQARLLLISGAAALLFLALPWIAAWALNAAQPNQQPDAAQVTKPAGTAVSSIGALFIAALAHVRGRIRDERRAVASVESKLGKHARRVREVVLAGVVTLGGPALLFAIGALGIMTAVLAAPEHATSVDLLVLGDASREFLVWLIGATALLTAFWVVTDMTAVSLHPFYRRRLCNAFALRRVWVTNDQDGRARVTPASEPFPDSGSVQARQRDYDRLVRLSKSGVEPGCCGVKDWPMLIVCAAANVSDPGATPPGRAVTSFTFSPKTFGGPLTGAAQTERYEALWRNRCRDVTLPAAVAMSGAALSPSMGKMTYRPMTFLLGLANIRLGVWVLNPAHVNQAFDPTQHPHGPSAMNVGTVRGKEVYERRNLRHRPRVAYLWRELFGHNRLDGKFLYITDGGHYENLGLVELLRRGCRTIYCFDAGGGTTEDSLADAISLAHSELNVDIEMEPEAIGLVEEGTPLRAQRACARGTITYPPTRGRGEAVKGTLYYVRSVVTPTSPWEVRAFQGKDTLFPHHSTLDQFFTDRRFEAYRALGHAAALEALALDPLHETTTEAPADAAPPTAVPERRITGGGRRAGKVP